MAINNAKHIISEINGIRCTIIETDIPLERIAFLTGLLEFNNLEVETMQDLHDNSTGEPKYTIGVRDIAFNPVFAVYERQLKTPEGFFVTPGYWKQGCMDCDPRYWTRRKGAKRGIDG